MKQLLSIFIFIILSNHVLGQVDNVTQCTFQIRKHSFEKGVIMKLRILTIFTADGFMEKDTLIDNKLFFKYKNTASPYSDYWHEAEDGSVWNFYPPYYLEPTLFIPSTPYIGYEVKTNLREMKITGINATKRFGTKTFGEVEIDSLIICEERNLQTNEIVKSYFKKGVGWVAAELGSWLTYVECISYPDDEKKK